MPRLDVNKIRTMAEPLGYKYTICLDREITDVEDFQEEILTIRQAHEGDIVHILLSSGGGSIETMKCMLSAMEQCQAHIITEICGDIASAATFLFLAGAEYRVSDNAEAMFHSAFFGALGKASDVKRQVDFTHKSCERLMRKYYNYFFTEDEIEELLNGREFWLDCDEIISRLENRQKCIEEENNTAQDKAAQAYMDEMFGDPIPPEILLKQDKDFLIRMINGELSEEEEEALAQEIESFGEDSISLEVDVGTTTDIDELKTVATKMGIPFPHNIRLKTLRDKIICKLDEEIVDDLNK